MDGPLVVRIAADWDCFPCLAQTPGGTGVWEGIHFTAEPVDQCDYLILFNNRRRDPVRTHCPRENVWAVMQEPYLPGLYDWLIEGHEPYARVYSHLAAARSGKYIPSHPAIPWHVGLSYDELAAAAIPEKTAGCSWITSNQIFLPGHRVRMSLRADLQQNHPSLVDIRGRGIRPVARKWDLLAPYKYSLAIENASGPNLWTEKIADCFLSWTVPLYFGCTNLETFFPEDSFIRIDPADPPSVARRIEELLRSGEWERRLPALCQARELVLTKYALFPFLAGEIRGDLGESRPKAKVEIPGYGWRRWRYLSRYLIARYITRRIDPAEGGDLASLLGHGFAPGAEKHGSEV